MPRVQPLSSDAIPVSVPDIYERFVKFGPFRDQAAVNRFNDALQIDDGRALAAFGQQESESQTQELE
ncbi:hypothetical protein [Bradyrhizobium cenepequi]